jgi:hypothetical protein
LRWHCQWTALHVVMTITVSLKSQWYWHNYSLSLYKVLKNGIVRLLGTRFETRNCICESGFQAPDRNFLNLANWWSGRLGPKIGAIPIAEIPEVDDIVSGLNLHHKLYMDLDYYGVLDIPTVFTTMHYWLWFTWGQSYMFYQSLVLEMVNWWRTEWGIHTKYMK